MQNIIMSLRCIIIAFIILLLREFNMCALKCVGIILFKLDKHCHKLSFVILSRKVAITI